MQSADFIIIISQFLQNIQRMFAELRRSHADGTCILTELHRTADILQPSKITVCFLQDILLRRQLTVQCFLQAAYRRYAKFCAADKLQPLLLSFSSNFGSYQLLQLLLMSKIILAFFQLRTFLLQLHISS